MKDFIITVNGKQYDVQVQELGESNDIVQQPIQQVQTRPAQVNPAPIAQTQPSQVTKPAVNQAANNNSGAKGKTEIKSPMPGTIMDVKVKAGDSVKSGTVLCILEALKMENEIMAPSDGVVASVNTSKGASVNTGDVLLTLN